MSNKSIIPVENLTLAKHGSDEDFKAVASGSAGFLPRLQLFSGNSDMTKRGKIPIAHYGLVTGRDSVDDLGPEVEILPVSWRPKAMRLTDDQVRLVV